LQQNLSALLDRAKQRSAGLRLSNTDATRLQLEILHPIDATGLHLGGKRQKEQLTGIDSVKPNAWGSRNEPDQNQGQKE
jgi:hypothetical protein